MTDTQLQMDAVSAAAVEEAAAIEKQERRRQTNERRLRLARRWLPLAAAFAAGAVIATVVEEWGRTSDTARVQVQAAPTAADIQVNGKPLDGARTVDLAPSSTVELQIEPPSDDEASDHEPVRIHLRIAPPE